MEEATKTQLCHGGERSDVAIQLDQHTREAGLVMPTRVSLAAAQRRSNPSSWIAAPSFLGLAMTREGVKFPG